MIARDLAQEKIDGSVVDYQEEESHAMSVNVVIGYEIATRDESFGKVKDVLVEEDSFKIRYFIVDTNHWLPGGKEVLISTDWIDDVNWHQSILSVNLTKDQVENAPELIDDEPINREMEERVFKHYGKPKYWD
ncbi:PRC-barrel domain-containing protein [Alteribacter populi]|uniref:PRC-barrel domain-containing protein n=1 Tax=Alteribacter populi TaxID=2011011 RepID=UPI0012FF6ED1|nr:PRC-barrel domain-containing protein [Alteribacter populi]